jgi:hypothetical protein
MRCLLVAMAVAISGCAALPAEESEKILIEHGLPSGLTVERTGLVFGSIGFVPRDEAVSAMSFHLRSLDRPGHRFEVFATNRSSHARWRVPDVDSPAQRLWVFSGRVPAGRYEIALAAVSPSDARDIHWINFNPPIPVKVAADGAVYMGRWQFMPPEAALSGAQVRVPGTPLVLRDAPEEDQLLLARKRGGSPLGKREIVDILRELMEQGRT